MMIVPTSRNSILAASVLFVLLLAGCGERQCQPAGGRAVQIFELYFGRSVAARAEISEKEWRDFRDQVITPALPNGYTVMDGQGAWLNPRSRATISEATKILVVALPDAPESLNIVNRIRSLWQHRFHQYVVGMTVSSGCGSFSPSEAPP